MQPLKHSAQLSHAISANDLQSVEELLTSHPELRQVLIDDVPLMSQAQPGRTPMMELLVRHGADVNGLRRVGSPFSSRPARISNRNRSNGFSITAPTPIAATPKIPIPPSTTSSRLTRATRSGSPPASRSSWLPGPARAMMSLAFWRSSAATPPNSPRSSLPTVAPPPPLPRTRLRSVRRPLLTLRGATLLHVAAEYGFFDSCRLLLDSGADVNARADIDANGVGGQTPILHALTHSESMNPEVSQLLIERGADLTTRARVPGLYERPGELLDVSATEYNAIFPLR
jgi:ankyrin repeat protein